MTVDEYDRLYPNVSGVCGKRVDNIKKGLKKVNPDTGLSPIQIVTIKRHETMQMIDDDGLSGYERLAIKTRQSNLNNIDERGFNGYRRTAEKARPKQIETLSKQGKIAR